jgi:ATP-dependent RNA helicase DDX46/PRP5
MTERQVKMFRKESGDIKVRGLQCPRPIATWHQGGLPQSVLDVLQVKNFQKPFPI